MYGDTTYLWWFGVVVYDCFNPIAIRIVIDYGEYDYG